MAFIGFTAHLCGADPKNMIQEHVNNDRTAVRCRTPSSQDHSERSAKAVKLMFGALVDTAERWKSIKVTEFA
jgi:hypothetical protein